MLFHTLGMEYYSIPEGAIVAPLSPQARPLSPACLLLFPVLADGNSAPPQPLRGGEKEGVLANHGHGAGRPASGGAEASPPNPHRLA
jgi:hypothetical protein